MADKFIPRQKLSKKARRKLDQEKRRTWGPINPVTRVAPVGKLRPYSRKTYRFGDDMEE